MTGIRKGQVSIKNTIPFFLNCIFYELNCEQNMYYVTLII